MDSFRPKKIGTGQRRTRGMTWAMTKIQNKRELRAKKSHFSVMFERGGEREREREREREKERRKESIKLLSTIYGALLVGIHRANNESSSHRRGLYVGSENTRFRQGSK